MTLLPVSDDSYDPKHARKQTCWVLNTKRNFSYNTQSRSWRPPKYIFWRSNHRQVTFDIIEYMWYDTFVYVCKQPRFQECFQAHLLGTEDRKAFFHGTESQTWRPWKCMTLLLASQNQNPKIQNLNPKIQRERIQLRNIESKNTEVHKRRSPLSDLFPLKIFT